MKRAAHRCPCGKTSFRTYEAAMAAGARLPIPADWASAPRADADRKRAAHVPPTTREVDQ